jgi:hypothetical protein
VSYRSPTLRLVRVARFAGAIVIAFSAWLGPVTAAGKPDPKICAHIVTIGKLNKSTTQARFESGDDSKEKFLAALNNTVTGMIPAHEALGKLVTKTDRIGVEYALKRMKALRTALKKTTAANVLDTYSKWATADVANFDVSVAKSSYVDLIARNAAACSAYPKIFVI